MGYSLWKFRQQGPSDLRDGDPTHGNTLLEIAWTAIPLIIVAVFGIWGAKIAGRQRGARRERPRDHRHRLQLQLRVPLRQRRRLHAQRRALRAGRRADHAAHDHAAVHAGHEERSRSSTASGCRSGGSSRTPRPASAARRSARRTSSPRASAPTRCSAPSCAAPGTARCTSRTSTCSRKDGLREVARRRQGGGGQGQAAGRRQPGPGGLQRLRAAAAATRSRPPRRAARPGRRWTT